MDLNWDLVFMVLPELYIRSFVIPFPTNPSIVPSTSSLLSSNPDL